ncbi:formimidoylglutamate deiminase [Rhodoligotrophos defluvii]|uniref:formimidoylglutamate deiminase n=1 Tax=Rhodoligotrophos defluvii TaxID=2561934 RepID=UPI0010C98D71|nr:formimidoylglutamate deiminase [Rhodoligotrophos defluvii]
MTTLFASTALLPGGLARDVAIEIEGDRIARVSAGATAASPDERHALIVPGMANLHSHAFQRAMSGLTERKGPAEDSFWSWRAVMYEFALSMTPDDVEAVAAQLYVEMLEAGFTRVGEFHYLHHDRDGMPYANIAEMAERIGAASVETGIGLTLLPVYYAHFGFGPKPPAEGQRRFINDRERFASLMAASRSVVAGVPGARLGVAPHSLRAATLPEIRDVIALPHDGPVHIHVAEQVLEVDECLEATGARPVELLLSSVDVTDRWCLIHATHMSDAELHAMARLGAIAGLCPITEANLGDGIFRAAEFRAAGGQYGVGSDSNVQISLAGELRQLEYSQRLARRVRNVLAAAGGSTGEALLLDAMAGGARALGVAAGIAEGMPADLASLDVSSVEYLPEHSLLDAFVFGSGVSVADVWVAGRKRVSGGRHRDRDAIRKRFEAAMVRLVRR